MLQLLPQPCGAALGLSRLPPLCYGILGVQEGLPQRRGCWDGEETPRMCPGGTHPANMARTSGRNPLLLPAAILLHLSTPCHGKASEPRGSW